MLTAKQTQIIASGPLFRDEQDPAVRQRLVLIKRRNLSGAAEFLIGVQTLGGGSKAGRLTGRRLGTRRRTLAVRFFCDYLLEQATRDDSAFETRASAA
jgi:hypothetical protein